jgi:hypothetical protein
MRAHALAALAASLAACAPTPPPAPTLPLARAQLAPGAAVGARGEARFAVKATRGGQGVAAQCRAEGQGFTAAFAAPAELAVPVFGPASAPIRVTCAAGGRSASVTAQPALRESGGIGGYPAVGIGVSSGGNVGVSLGGWWGNWGSDTNATYTVRYPDLAISLD